jgi:trehalose synthase
VAFQVEVETPNRLADFALYAHLVGAVEALRQEAKPALPKLRGRTIWMVNSTARGGGVAEMLPTMVALLRDLGVATEWAVIESPEPRFFELTKRIHNLIHGHGEPKLGPVERELFERVNRDNAAALKPRLREGDVLVVHDPQPMPLAAILKRDLALTAVWRCHIGLDAEVPATRAAWEFLRPYAQAYDRAVFSAPEYVPPFLADRATIIYPALDPLSAKNRELGLHNTVAVLSNAGLAVAPSPLWTPPYRHMALRLAPDGGFYPVTASGDFGLLTRPIVTQISRWDRLKGFEPLLAAFAGYRRRLLSGGWSADPVHRVRQELARLVLAGPSPESVQDDPEAGDVLEALKAQYAALDPLIQEAVAILSLPMVSAEQNALMVNALQRASSIVVQNSLREGFGLTVAEAMWKRVPILSNRQACGPRHQVRDGEDGRLIADPEDVVALADTMDAMLHDATARRVWARNAQRHVHANFLVFAQLGSWLRLLDRALDGPGTSPAAA